MIFPIIHVLGVERKQETKTIITMVHLGARAFGQISGEVVQTTAWVLNNQNNNQNINQNNILILSNSINLYLF